MTPERISADDPRLPQALALIRSAFAGMEGRIDPPSSMHRMNLETFRQDAVDRELWGIGDPLVACVLLTPKTGCLYIGKLAVSEALRGRGLARALIHLADRRAADLGLSTLELQTRVELIENHAMFERLGFERVGETAHAGYDRPTSYTYQKPVSV